MNQTSKSIILIVTQCLLLVQLVRCQNNLTCYVCYNQYPNAQIYQHDDCETPDANESSLIPLPCNPDQDTCMVSKK